METTSGTRAIVRPPSPLLPVVALPVVALLGWPLLTAGFTNLIRSSECVASEGLLGFVARSLAMMRPVADCPTGTLGFGPHTPILLGILAALAVSLVLLNLAAAGLGMWLSASARAVLAVLATLRRRRRLPTMGSVPTTQRTVVDWLASAVGPRPPARQVQRRGPPGLAY